MKRVAFESILKLQSSTFQILVDKEERIDIALPWSQIVLDFRTSIASQFAAQN